MNPTPVFLPIGMETEQYRQKNSEKFGLRRRKIEKVPERIRKIKNTQK